MHLRQLLLRLTASQEQTAVDIGGYPCPGQAKTWWPLCRLAYVAATKAKITKSREMMVHDKNHGRL
jgi:hypothetical protein